YWLMIVAAFDEEYPYAWGWTNHYHMYNDDAVHAYVISKNQFFWEEVHDQTGETADMSFTIYTDPTIELDFGDANDPTYPTLLANDGARHIIGGPWFGDPCIVADDVPDPETDGQPNPPASGDDADGNDDEDGVSMGTWIQGVATYDNYMSVSGPAGGAIVDFWIDWNGDGDWADPCDALSFGFMANGNYTWGIGGGAFVNSIIGQTFARFRISSAGGLAPTGLAIDGEVEDLAFYIEGRDWGDAPDDPCTPMYPTLAANNGAVHRLTGSGGPWFGPADDKPDNDVDGQPDPDALGDDNDAQGDDEDGITIPTLIQSTITNITVEVAGGPAYVHGWIDFNDDGDWNDAGELIINGTLLPDGSNPVAVTVPNNATVGETFARFRIVSGIVASATTGLWDDGEVEDHKVTIETKVKYSQPPEVMDPSPPPVYLGWDELSMRNGPQIVADDWPCEDQRPVSDVHWWGSYQGWVDPCRLPAVVPIGFHIGIWTDVAVGADPCVPWSHPKKMIWEYNAGMAVVNEQFVGFDSYPTYPLDVCYRYDLQLQEDDWYWQDPNYRVHWISISAVYSGEGDPPQNPWGWKTRQGVWNDTAVRIIFPTAPNVGDPYVFGEPILDPFDTPMDMAFELTTHECYPVDDPHYQTWASFGYPRCWCYQYNCKGDTDNIGTGFGLGKKWVVLADLNLLAASLAKRQDDVTLPVNYQCANFDRLGTGFGLGKKWVVLPDLNILASGLAQRQDHPHFGPGLPYPFLCPGW
ncbi:MAG: DUF7901 domain-containing protein, partial [Planctomycetota bacterium]